MINPQPDHTNHGYDARQVNNQSAQQPVNNPKPKRKDAPTSKPLSEGDDMVLFANRYSEIREQLEELTTLIDGAEDKEPNPQIIEQFKAIYNNLIYCVPDGYTEDLLPGSFTNDNCKTKVFNRKLTGKIANANVFNSMVGGALGIANRVDVFLPYAGCWATVGTPTSMSVNAFVKTLSKLLERDTIEHYAIPYKISQAPLYHAVADFALNHIKGCNIDAPVTAIINADTISRYDLDALLTAIIGARYSDGVEFDLGCVVCGTKDSVHIDLPGIIRYVLPDELKESPVYTSPDSKSVSHTDYTEYRKLVVGKEYTYKLNNTLSVTFSTPCLSDWYDTSVQTTGYLKDLLEDSVDSLSDFDDDDYDELESALINEVGVLELTSSIKRITIVNSEGEAYTETFEGILKFLDTVKSSPAIADKLVEHALTFVKESTLSLQALPVSTCAKHKKDDTNNTLPVPVEPLSFFMARLRTMT